MSPIRTLDGLDGNKSYSKKKLTEAFFSSTSEDDHRAPPPEPNGANQAFLQPAPSGLSSKTNGDPPPIRTGIGLKTDMGVVGDPIENEEQYHYPPQQHLNESSIPSDIKTTPRQLSWDKPQQTRRRSSSNPSLVTGNDMPAIDLGSPPTPHFSRRPAQLTRRISGTQSVPSLLAQSVKLVAQSLPSLLLSLLGLIFTGQLIEHLARWSVFKRVDELFILVPVLTNLKGNLEMNLGARLGTLANQGHLDTPSSRFKRIKSSITFLLFQALTISSLAGIASFLLGLLSEHRVIDSNDGNGPAGDVNKGYDVGYTKPGIEELGFVVASGMITASLSSLVLGGFMSGLVVVCRWGGVDPDNIASPVASCLGDLLTLFILALLGTSLVKLLESWTLGLIVLGCFVASVWLGWSILRSNKKLQNPRRTAAVAAGKKQGQEGQGGWGPLIGAMLISSATGLVLDKAVSQYKGFALYAITMTGISGSVGAIHASRLSTSLQAAASSSRRIRSTSISIRSPGIPSPPSSIFQQQPKILSSFQSALTLFFISIPVQLFFLGFVGFSGWVDLSGVMVGILMVDYLMTIAFSLVAAQVITMFVWRNKLDPDSYVLPVHSALIDLVGQLLLVVAFQIAKSVGLDVIVSS